MKIKITHQDIINGHRADVHRCPIALALKRAFKGADVAVMDKSIIMIDGIYLYRYWLSPKLRDFVYAFDHRGRKSVKPCSFDLEQLRPIK